MAHSSSEFTTTLVENTQQVIVYKEIEFISNITQSFDFSIRAIKAVSQTNR